MRAISARRMVRKADLLVEEIRENPLEAIAQALLPVYTSLIYSSNLDRALPARDGHWYVLREWGKRALWDAAKFAGLAYGVNGLLRTLVSH